VQLGLPARVSRRRAIQWVMAAATASALPTEVPTQALAQTVGQSPTPQEHALKQAPVSAKGYGTDPKLVLVHKPGDLWPLTFTAAQHKTAGELADVILPRDEYGPAASAVGVVEMIDEWISAPYPQQQGDRPVIIDGLAWLEVEANHRFTRAFTDLTAVQKHAICDDICHGASAKEPFRRGARFFGRFRSLCAGAYYATPAGWKAIGYVGNIPLPSFDGPPPEVLARLGVTQTVK
jgi:hypothetical protein